MRRNASENPTGIETDYSTRYPSRVAVMSNDNASQERYALADGTPGVYTKIHRDDKIEDAQVAEVLASEMLMTSSKQTASLTVLDDTLKAGDVVQLTLIEPGIAIDKTMKILNSSLSVGVRFIYNQLDMEEV